MLSPCGGELLHRALLVLCSRTVQYLRRPASIAASISFFSSASEAAEASWRPPIKVSITDSASRGVFASRSFVSGELIYTAKPLVTHPSLALSDRGCLNVESKADWSLYHDRCRIKSLKYPLMVKRFACMVISEAASADSLDILQPASLPPEAFSEMEEEFDLLKSTLLNCQLDEKRLAFLTKQWYIDVLARIRINAFRIELVTGLHEDLFVAAMASVANEDAVGNAVYMLPSFHNHDCDPNTHILWIDSAVARLKALRDIEEGEELRICYLDASMGRDARQNLLARGFGFECRCLRCLSGD